MHLRELEILGFKSFARKTRFEFEAHPNREREAGAPGRTSITAIIGPNGSGKSNFAEAIRWVLGEQSLKSLRGRKSEDVIFAGSAGSRGAGSARVSLTLSNESNRLPLEAAEVTITRTLNRSGDSEYLLNGDPVRLHDIQTLLAEAGLGTKSYAVISQGMVDQYLTAQPAARRELFDEATGVKALQLKLQRAERTLAAASATIHELQTVLRELEPRLQVLRRQQRRHEERGRLEQVWQTTQAAWYRSVWHKHNTTALQADADVTAAAERLVTARHQREHVEANLLRAARLGEGRAEEQTVETLKQQLLQAQQEFERASDLFEQRCQERSELAASLDAVRAARIQAERELNNARQTGLHATLFTRLRETLERCYHLLKSLQAGSTPRDDDVTRLLSEIAAATQHLQHEDAAIAAAQSIIERLEGPLQAVARLQAIEQERTERWQALPTIEKPSSARLQELQSALAAGQPAADTALEQQLAAARSAELAAEREHTAASGALAQVQVHLADITNEILRERGTTFLESLQHAPPDANEATVTEADVLKLSGRLAALGEVDPLALKEYEEVAARYEHLSTQFEDARAAYDNTQTLIRSLQKTIEIRFRTQFQEIQKHFRAYFHELFNGGQASLDIVEVPLEEEAGTSTVNGVEISVHPPGKKPQHVHLLSGGEKALTSLALLLAIVRVQQPPFLVLDEVDAALDEANSFRFARLLQDINAQTQCVVITHNRETMGQADILYGITMHDDGISRVYSVSLAEIAETETNEDESEVQAR